MWVDKPNGIEQSNNKSNWKYNSVLGSILQMPLPENLKTTWLAIVVHHGETDWNLWKNAMDGKSKMEPLNQKWKEEILEIAKILKEKIPEWDIGRVRIHVNDEVLRNRQTAEIIEKELWISTEQIIFSEDLRSQDKVYDENHKLIRQEYFSSSDHEWKSESIPKLRSMAADYVASTIENNPDLIHIFVTNRVSYKWFENWADKDLDAIHDYKLKTWIMRIVPVNKDWKPLNYIDPNLPIKDQEGQIKFELLTIASELNIHDIDEFSDNLFDKNNRSWLRFLDFCKVWIEKWYTNIMTSLFIKYPNLLWKTIKILLPEIHDEKWKKFIDTVVLGYLKNVWISEDNENIYLSLLNALHENNGNWKYLFRELYLYDSEILLQHPTIKNDDILSYYETLQKQSENNKEYQSNIVPIFLWEVEWDKFFVPVTMEKNGETFSVDTLIQNILNTNENAFYIQWCAGSWKTILTKYLAKELWKQWNNWIKMIDLNTVENFSQEEFAKNIPSDFDWNIIIIFDWLDEKNRSKVKQLLNYLQDTKSDNIKYICSSRFFPTDLLNGHAKLKSKTYRIKDMGNLQLKEIIKKYTENLDNNLKEEFENKLNSILQKIWDTNHSPLIITMLISIVQDYVCNDEYYEILDQDDINLSDIYDTFVKFLHNRENSKKGKCKSRAKSENVFMSQRYNGLRIEFLSYLSLCGQGYFNTWNSERKNNNITEVYDKLWLSHLFLYWVNQNKKDLDISYELVGDFIDSLVNYWFLQIESNNQSQLAQLWDAEMLSLILDLPSYFNVVDNYFFPHKTFQEYFGCKNLKNFNYNEIKNNVKILLEKKSLWIKYWQPTNDIADRKYLSYYNQIKGILLSYGFDDISKLLKLIVDLTSEILYGPDFDPYVSERFETIVEDLLCEYFSNDSDIKYKHLKLIEDNFPDRHIWWNLSLLECLKKEFVGNEVITNKLNNIDKFWEDIIWEDYQLDNFWISFYSWDVKALLKGVNPGNFICCILFDRDFYFDFEQDI